MPAIPRPTLRQVFALSLLGLLLSLALLFSLVFRGSQQTILRSAERFRETASRDVIERVTNYLNEAPMAVAHFEQGIRHGLIDPQKPDSLEAGLLALLLANENISEASLTYGERLGFDAAGNLRLNTSTAGQVALFRAADGEFLARRTWFDGKQFVSESSAFRDSARDPARPKWEAPVPDPTAHLTFITPASSNFYGQLLWTDLHWSQLDDLLPREKRRVEVSVQKAIENPRHEFAGVLRVGLLKEQIDRVVQQPVAAGARDPHLIFLCDDQGRLITGFGPADRVAESGDDLRLAGADVPPPVSSALGLPEFKTLSAEHPVATTFRVGDGIYLATFWAFPKTETQDWIVGIVVPRDYYLGPLLQIRREVLWASLALICAIVAVGSWILHNVGRAHALVVGETSRMKRFEFSPSRHASRLRDVGDVLDGLEKAKTAMRAMGKYVPVDLVRRLYHDGQEPVLGGESMELSVLFADIREFTPFAERIEPDKLADVLGRYLDVMATVIQREKGTIDKYIGDAVMAFWNAPEPVADHAVLACCAALKCRAALAELYASPAWQGLPRFETRFGLHRCTASVGHFGAPDRFNYTAIGDGINLASRLETLNNVYGTGIIVSETIYAAARERFEFRLLDRVAVKGKVQGVTIHELLGERAAGARPAHVDGYERAFAAYQRADFAAALALLSGEAHDAPSLVLAGRCRAFLANPPREWTGVHVFGVK